MFTKSKNRGRKLNKDQKKIRELVIQKLKNKEYKEINRPCICGSTEEKIIAKEDRYGIPLTTVICKNCGLVRCNPYYDDTTINDFYSNYYRSLYTSPVCSEKDFEKRVRRGEKIIKNIENSYNLKITNQKVYEIGCASGAMLKAFKNKGCDVYGCDYGTEWIEYGRNQGLTLVDGSYDKLEQFGQADIIILSHVLEHVVDPVTFLKGIKSLLKDNGIFYIALPTIERIESGYKNNLFDYLQNAHIYNFSNNTAKYVFEISGYKIDKLLTEQGVFICKKSDKYREISDVDKQEYKKVQKQLKHYEFNYHYKKITDTIFSVHNYYKNDIKQKKITIFGIKLTFKVKNNK